MISSHTILEGHAGLLFKKGKIVRTLEFGQHWLIGPGHKLVLVDMRPRTYTVGGQEVATADGAMVRISVILRNRVVDPALAYRSGDASIDTYSRNTLGPSARLHTDAQVAMRQWVSVRKFDEALREQNELGPYILESLKERAVQVGLAIEGVEILDFSPTGGLKGAMADVVKAEIEGQAALARARSEAATMRSLLNTARLVREHPRLLDLRILATGQKPRVTFMVHGGGDAVSEGSTPTEV